MANLRLDKILAHMGVGTRKEIKVIARRGEITLNGHVIKDVSTHIDFKNDVVEVNGKKVEYREFVYIMVHKPDGVISATEDARHDTVLDLLHGEYANFDIFPVGRLDKDTEGLLILTNDGKLAHELLSPKKHVPKTYFAEVEGVVNEDDIKAFQDGVTLDDGYKTFPAELKIIKAGELSEIELIIHEGKFHQVKRMFAAVDKKVVYLKRIAMGNLTLDDKLALGEYRELTTEELQLLKSEK